MVASSTPSQGFRLGQHKPLELVILQKIKVLKVGSEWKVWFDSALHDPLDLALSLLLVTLLPLVNQGPF